MTIMKTKGVKLVHNTLHAAIEALAEAEIQWDYCHQPSLPRAHYRYPSGLTHGDREPGLFYYFVDTDGREVASWCIPLQTVQFFDTPREVNRDFFPDGERIYRSTYVT